MWSNDNICNGIVYYVPHVSKKANAILLIDLNEFETIA